MLNVFRVISWSEGLSFLFLLLVAMPAKYYFGMPELVKYAGWMHGCLFMAYLFLAADLSSRYRWSSGFSALVFMASLIPTACFFLDKRLRDEQSCATSC